MQEYIYDRTTIMLNRIMDNYAEEDREEEVDTIRDDVMIDDEIRNFRPQADDGVCGCKYSG